ncbi:MAG TPA: 50S ribosomal protein L11 methyltransferase [Sediminibacterium sp.]|nr:50S ribosomal protein L11 methyltransferase [Sediminibacterium sp.]
MDKKYIQIEITGINESASAIAIAELSQVGFDGFLEEVNSLKAYSKEGAFDQPELNIIMNKLGLRYSLSVLDDQNWNKIWESNFSPVVVDDFVGIRAAFHPPVKGMEYELVITPKMSFGTGHHATTYTVIQLMRELDFKGKRVFDFGTGTGILAILAEKMGASSVLAVDNDAWCIENSRENTSINACKIVYIQQVDSIDSAWDFDIVVANINRHIIEVNLSSLPAILRDGGSLILSGLLQSDEKDMLAACDLLGFTHQKTLQKDGWIAIYLTK